MEFGDKLQQLRKQKGWTQEELAGLLFVSRAAVSKWESGRGYPEIDSLKAISKLLSVSVDDLLSGEDLISLAENEQKEKAYRTRNLVYGILDCMVVLLFFLPLFAQQGDGLIITVPLFSWTEGREYGYVLMSYVAGFAVTILFGVAQLALQNWQSRIWLQSRAIISLALSVLLIMFTMANRQTYPGALLLCLLSLKGILLIKRP